MEGVEIENKDEVLKSQVAVRCAKAAMFLLSLQERSPNRRLDSTYDGEQQEKEMKLKREVEDLKWKLVRERVKCRRMRMCSVMELLLQMVLLLSFWTLCLMLAFRFF